MLAHVLFNSLRSNDVHLQVKATRHHLVYYLRIKPAEHSTLLELYYFTTCFHSLIMFKFFISSFIYIEIKSDYRMLIELYFLLHVFIL